LIIKDISPRSRQNWDQDYDLAKSDVSAFWKRVGKRLSWAREFTSIDNVSFQKPVHIKWYEDGLMNASINCVDRHLQSRGDQAALICVPDEPGPAVSMSYKQLHTKVCQMANVLKCEGVRSGDKVVVYMPMIAEAVIAMLACARIGAIHVVVFAGFAPQALASRIQDCQARFVITADVGYRGGKALKLKDQVDLAIEQCASYMKTFVFRRLAQSVVQASNEIWIDEELLGSQRDECEPHIVQAEHPLFILYTSGSTGKPKGIVHSTGGYLAYASYTHEAVFQVGEADVYWCTADIGWITGHSYVVYGPLCNGSTVVLFEGVPTYPNPSRWWDIIDELGVTHFYTAPTAIRSLMSYGEGYLASSSRRSLKVLGSVGEPINPAAWEWYYEQVGRSLCLIADTWWQTETGGVLLSPLPGATYLKPGSAQIPLPGIEPVLMGNATDEVDGEGSGYLCMRNSWPGQARSLFGDHAKFEEVYFSQFPGLYYSGDGAVRDGQGDLWITGRMDDVLNVSGHRLSTAEIENALVGAEQVVEAAVVGYPHSIKGEGIYAYVILKEGSNADHMEAQLKAYVRQTIGAIAAPDFIQSVPALPKTRSGKIMRRILRKIAANETENFGDLSTLADDQIIDQLIVTRKNLKME
jgi:acetyl-CoA synthetase